MEPTEKPFLRCVIKESKRVYKQFVLYGALVCCVVAIIALIGYVLILAYPLIVSGIVSAIDIIDGIIQTPKEVLLSVVSVMVSLPWWVYAISLIVISPFLYSVLICWERNASRKQRIELGFYMAIMGVIVVGMGILVGAVSVSVADPVLGYYALILTTIGGAIIILSPSPENPSDYPQLY